MLAYDLQTVLAVESVGCARPSASTMKVLCNVLLETFGLLLFIKCDTCVAPLRKSTLLYTAGLMMKCHVMFRKKVKI